MTKGFRFFLVFILAITSVSYSVFSAPELGYDPYAPIYGEIKQPTNAEKAAYNFLIWPFELIRWPIDQGLILAEKHHLYTKTLWSYDLVQDLGVTPKIGFGKTGAEIDFVRLARQKVNHPDLILKGETVYNFAYEVFSTEARLGVERIKEAPVHIYQDARYQNRPEEHFYGIGPDTSAGEGTSFHMETTALESIIGLSPTPTFSADAKFGYRNINITNGEDGGRGIIDNIFPTGTIPGLDGDEIITMGLEVKRDSRNKEKSSTAGTFTRAGIDFNEGLFGSEARYFKYVAEGTKYVKLGSERRVLAGRVYAEYNQDFAGKEVPFHQMAKLGGYGNFPSLSQPLRAYDTNRFFDKAALSLSLEYRYNVYEYRNWKMDMVFFCDEGQVFRKLSKFQLKDFRESYGGGLRISILDHVLLSIEAAHGDEGTNFYVRSGTAF